MAYGQQGFGLLLLPSENVLNATERRHGAGQFMGNLAVTFGNHLDRTLPSCVLFDMISSGTLQECSRALAPRSELRPLPWRQGHVL